MVKSLEFSCIGYLRNNKSVQIVAGWSGVRWCLVNFRVPGVLQIWIRVGQGPTVLAVGAGGVVWTFFSRLSFLFSFSLSL